MKKIYTFLVTVSILIFLGLGKVFGTENLSIRVLGPSTANPGGDITYTIIYLNAGDTKAQNVEIVQSLPSGNYTYVSSSPQGAYSSTSNTITWNKSTTGMSFLESLGAGARSIQVTVKAGVKGGTPGFASAFTPNGYFINPNPATLLSSAKIKSDFNTSGTVSNTVSTSVTQICSALLNIAAGSIKSATGTPVVYLVQVINSGNIYNKFDLTATNYPCGALPFDPLTWRFLDITGNVITKTDWIAPGQSFLVLFEVSCPPGSNPGKSSCHTVSATSEVCNSVSAVENTQTLIVPSPKEAMVLLAKAGSNDVVQSGDTLIYTLYAFNSNDAYPANNLSITDVLPPNVTYIKNTVVQQNSTITSNTYNPGTKTVTLNFSSLSYGTSNAITVSIYTKVNSLGGTCSGSFSNTASATYTGATSVITSTKATTITNKPDLKITKIATPTPNPAAPDGTIKYTLVYENIGNCTATNVSITDLYDNIHTTDGGSNTGTKSFAIGTLTAGAKDSVTYTVSIFDKSKFPDGTTTILNVATISGSETEMDYNNNTATASVYVAILSDLKVTKTVNSEPGNILEVGKSYTYTLSVVNNGDISATNVVLSDTLPSGFTFVSASNGGVLNGKTITWPSIASLAVGASTTFTCTVVINISCDAIGNITNVAHATSTTNDANESDNTAHLTSLVKDTEKPKITCTTPAASYAADNGVCSYTVPGTALDPVSTSDNCTIKSVINSINHSSTLKDVVFALGTTHVMWVITDGSDNKDSCEQIIVVTDTQKPVLTCPTTLNEVTNTACTFVGSIGTATATDNCTVSGSISITNDAPAAFPLGTTTVTWHATDAAGNIQSGTQSVIITDTEKPVAISKNITVSLGITGTVSVAASDVNNGSTDNCGIQTMSVSPSTFGCTDVGPHTVTLTVTDNSGNTATCTSTVTVTDPLAPSLSINDVTVTEGTDAQASFTVSMTNARTCDVTFTVNTANNTALAGSDYTAKTNQTYTIPAGQTSVAVNVLIGDNLIVEPTETFFVNLSNPQNTVISDAQGIGTILDNDATSIAINDITVSESAGTAGFTVTLTGNIQDALTVDFTTTNGTALAGSDFTASSGKVTFPAGSITGATQAISVPIINDLFTEPTESFTVNLSNIVSTGSASISDNQGVCTITDNDAVSVAINDMSVSESAGTALFTVTLTGNIQDVLTVNYATSNGTALAGSDYTASSGTLTFPAGSLTGTTKTISVPILNDAIAEPTETYNITLSSIANNGTATISDNLGIGTITDNDAASVAINDISVSESAGTATFTVTLTGSIQDVLTVDFATANGTALAGSDYTSTNGTLTFNAGSVSGATKTFTVTILNDAIAEPTETFNATLSNIQNSGSASISDNSGICTITDNDAVSIAINDVSVSESAGTATFTVTLTGTIQDVLTVNYVTSNGTALAGSDYTTTSGTVTFPANSINGATQSITVSILNDAIAEPTETFNVNLNNIQNSGSASIADNLGVGTITDNDAASVAINDVTVSESAGTATFTVTLTGTIQDALSVNFATSNVTALAGSDYTATSGTLTFAAGSLTGATKTISVVIINDIFAEPTETFNVNLSGLVSTASASISDNLGVGTITDDAGSDAVSVAINDMSVNESAGTALFTVTLTGNIQDALTVNYATSNGTALSGSDYTATSGTVTFPAGSLTGTTKTISVPILNDAIAEPSETYTVTLSGISSTGTATISDNSGLGTIIDNDAASLAINDVTVSEAAGTATFTVTLTGTIQDALTVNYATSNGTALAGSDYTATSGTLTFAAGSVTGTTKTISVTILNDNFAEPTETFNVNLSNIVSTGSASISDNLGIGTITDDAVNDAVSVAINDMSVNESAGTAVFTVTLTGNIQDALTVNYATSNGTALSGSDYTSTSGTVTFSAGSLTGTTKTISVTILNDAIAEPTETFNVNLSGLVSTGSASISDNLGIGTITDNDVTSIAINDVTVSEAAGTATFTVTLTGTIQDALSVNYATSNVTALAGSDYTATSGTLNFAAGSITGATKTITVTILNDAFAEPTETFNVNLSGLVSTASASISDNLGIGTITDDAGSDAVSVAIDDVTVGEAAGTAVFTVTLTGNIQDALTVNYITSNGTALAGSDYTSTNGTVTFPAGSLTGTTKTISVTILNDAIAEPSESFNVTLSGIVSTGTASISDNLGVGTINDNDASSVAINDVSVSESAGTATLTVTLTGTIQDALTVDYATSNGTALAGSDYTTSSGTLTFPAGSLTGATKTISIPIINDAISEPTETFDINLSNIINAGSTSISDGLGICTITDDAANDAVSIAINDVTISESSPNAIFTVTLTGNIQDALTVDFATSDISALAGFDYTASSGTVTFPANSVSGATQTISVPILLDGIAEAAETFNVTLSNLVSTGTATMTKAVGLGTIIDINAVSVVINDVTVLESAGTASFTVTLIGTIASNLTVDYATSDGTAKAISDYTSTSGTLTFTPTDVTKTINVPIIDNTITEPTEIFNMNLSNVLFAGSASIDDNLGIGTILDDGVNDAVSVSINDVTVSETDGTATFTVTLAGNIQDAMTVDFATSDVTALAGSDYTAKSGTITFPANSVNGATQTIDVTILNNSIAEPTETFNMNLSNILSSGSASINDNLGIGTITDDAANDKVSVAINDVTVSETDGSATFTVTLTGNIQDAMTVDFATSDGSAKAGSDYTATSGTVTFPANSINGATQSIVVAIIDNSISEPTETFNMNLSNIVSTGSASISDNLGIGTITDDAANDAVSVAINDVTVSETAGNAVFTITLTGNIQDALMVDFATSDGTALAGSDYTLSTGTVTFVAGSVSGATQSITVPIINNSVSEPTETFDVNLSNIISSGTATISDNKGVGTILDDAVNDAVSVAINDITVSETDGTATFTVTLTGNIQDAMTVDYATSNGTALAGSDYTAKSGTITFPANSVNGATQSILVTILNNSIAEPTETLNMNLSNILSTGSASISDNLGICTITDDAVNDAVSVAINDVTVSETDGTATFTVTLTGNIQDAMTVDFATSNGTALAGSDYTATSGTVTFPANSTSGATQLISVAIIDNQISEPTETFNMNLSNIISTGSASISDNLGIGTITDDAVNDAVSIAINDVTVSETAGNAIFTVTLTGNIQDALTVDFATSDITALAGSDYTLSTGTVTFVAGSVSGATQNISVPIINNSVSEPTETFNVTLSNLLSTGSASISDNIGVGTILDDAVNDAVSIAINDITVSETDGTATFTVSLTGNIQDAMSVDYATSNGTALAGSDYTAKSGTITFPANSVNGATQSIVVTILDNSIAEPTETFNMNLSNLVSTGSASISDNLGICTITDDAVNDAVSVAINDVTVSETAGNAIFTVTLSGNIQDAMTVDFATSDVTALAGSDYTASSGTITFPANSSNGATQTITIPIIDNLISEPTETFNVNLSNILSTGSASISDNLGIGTITDDAINDAASISINDVTVNETAGTAVFTVTLTGNIQDAMSVDFATSDGTALAGSDYTTLSGTVTFPANSISGATQTITIAILDNAISEPTETFNVNLSNLVSTGSATISDNLGIGTIIDDAVNDAVSIAINDVTVNETAGNAVFTVTLTGNIQDALTVDFATANVTALAGSDYTATSGTLTFVAGSISGATQSITVPIINNSVSEPTETFNVNLSNLVSTGSASMSDNLGVGTIIDDAVNDAVTVAINDVTVSETAGSAVFTVTLTGNIQDALTVDFATSNGTAIAGSDYTATSGTVTFPAGSVSGATKTINVAIINNLITEPTEFFNVNLSNIQNSGNASISDNLGIGTITDDAANDAVSVAITDVMVNENAGTAVFIVTLTGNIQDALTMDYATSNGTALAGSDYSSVSGKVTFPAGSVSESFQTITVPIFNDLITEPTETYNVNLSNIISTGTATISDNLGLGTIIDNDAVSLAINDVTVNENAGSAVFTVTLTGNTQDALTVNYATSNGTALAGSDYTTASGIVTFPANSVTGTIKTISVSIINDAITEPTETFNVNLSNVVSTGTASISDNLGIGTITDDAINDAVKVAINDVTVNENAGTAVFTVTLTGNIQDQLTVDFATANGTAIAGNDYSAFSGTVIFPAGSISGATKTISVAITNDLLTEPTETFTVTLSNLVSNGSASIFDTTGIGTITDNDASTVAINDVTVSESAGTATFTVTLTGNIQDVLTVDFATSNGTAMAGSDYIATSGTISFAAGSVTGATKSISIPIIDNTVSEPTETFNVNLSNIISNGSASISDNLGIGTITDDASNDAVSVAISDATSSESSGSTTFTVTLTGNIQDALTVDYATSNGTAHTGSDYSSNSGTITFPANSVSGATKTITVSFFNDAIAEPTETFNVTLSNLVSTGSASISDNLGIGTITDDDASSVAINDVTASEADGTATFTITLTGNIQDALTLDYATSNGTAIAGSDYTTTSGTITFPANSVSGTTQLVSVIILNDAITEPTETFNVNLSNIINSGITSISDNLGIGTITDDAANDAVSVSINDITVSETAGNAVFTVTLKGNIQDALTVDFTTSDVTAKAGSDYTATSGIVTFPAGSMNGATQSITVPIIDNTFTEPTETFEIVLSNIVNTGSASISDNFGICTIIDDAVSDGVSITINDVTVNEADGNAVFTVTLTGNIQDAMTIDFATANVIAEAGSDYTATSGKVTFPAGSVSGATQTITVPILEDINTEATESFTVILSNIVCTGTANITDAIGLGTIIDNDAATITIDDVIISENGGTALFTVKVTGNVQDVLTVDYATSDGTALDGSDYTGTSGTLIFPVHTVSGATQTIAVPILTDIFAEPTETFNVNLSNLLSSGAASIGDNLGIGTITDDATNAVSVAIDDVTISENGGLAIFKVTLTGNIQDALSVDFATADVTAKAGSDYSATSGTVTFPAGSITGATQSIPVTILNDAISEPTETFNVNVSNIVSTGIASISDNIGIGTITDDAANDAVSIAINDVTVNEIDGSAVFTVTLKGNIQDALTVDFATADGTAKAGSDYTATSGTLTFPALSIDGATQSITIPIINDNFAESTETFNVNLSNIVSTGTATISDNLGIGTIIDDAGDATNVAIDDVTVNESAGNAVFTVTLQGNIQDALTVDFATSDGSALAGSDYTTTTGTVTFPANSVSGATQSVTVPIIDNSISEPTESFTVTLSNIVSTGTALISDNEGIGTITDDDILTIDLTAFTTTETNATQTQNFTATMSGKAEKDLFLSFSTTDGTAASGSDFTAQTAVSYTIAAGSTSVSIPVDVLGDLISEPTETFIGTITISNANAQQISIGTDHATATILDDDIADLSITKESDKPIVIAGTNITYTIEVKNLGTNTASDVVVNDVLPSGLTFVSASTVSGIWSVPTWSIGSLASGSSATLTIVATVNTDVSNGTILSNTAVVSSSTTDPVVINNTATTTSTVNNQTDLAITKTLQTTNVVMGEAIQYQIAVMNNGPSIALGVSLADTPPGISDVEYSTDDGANWNAWTSPLAVGTMANGASVNILLKGIVNMSQCEAIVNTASVSCPNMNDPDMSNNSATSSVSATDKTKPTITCPPTVSVAADKNSCYAIGVALGTPVTNDNCTVASVTNDAPVAFSIGNTTVTWTVTDGAGNKATCTQTVTVIDDQKPIISCPATVIINTEDGSYSTIGIDLGTPLTGDNCTIASITNNAPEIYPLGNTEIIWTVTDGSGNTASCTQLVIGPKKLFIPTGFSPNGDGVNDYFVITDIVNYPKNHLWVYNRWGNVIYEKKIYDNTWDGKQNVNGAIYGSDLPEGTYFYILDLGDDSTMYQGYVVIKR